MNQPEGPVLQADPCVPHAHDILVYMIHVPQAHAFYLS